MICTVCDTMGCCDSSLQHTYAQGCILEKKHNQVSLNGDVHDGTTVSLDHCVQKMEVTIRSLSGVHAQTIKDFLQRRYQVVDIKELERTDFVSSSISDFWG